MKVYILMARNIVETKNQLIADDNSIYNVFASHQDACEALCSAKRGKENRLKYHGYDYKVEKIENGYMWRYKDNEKAIVTTVTEVLEILTEEVQ